jgi:hypothetical protein
MCLGLIRPVHNAPHGYRQTSVLGSIRTSPGTYGRLFRMYSIRYTRAPDVANVPAIAQAQRNYGRHVASRRYEALLASHAAMGFLLGSDCPTAEVLG